VSTKVIRLPAGRRLRKLPPQGIVDYLFPRRSRAMGGLVDEPGDIGVKSQRGAHIGIIVPPRVGIKMPMEATGEQRFDVVIDRVGGQLRTDTLPVMAPMARMPPIC
jgi:hypothetical protein